MKHETFYRDNNGLAIYSTGTGKPILFMPNPGGFTTTRPTEFPVFIGLIEQGYRVVTFDPPGAYSSSRSAHLTMQEMLDCALEALKLCEIREPVALVGHSMGGFCALAFALWKPDALRWLLLIDTIAGKTANRKREALPWCWKLTDKAFWRFICYGILIGVGRGNMAMHKQMINDLREVSFFDKSQFQRISIEPGDNRLPALVRDRWGSKIKHLDYSDRLNEITVPVLVCVGRHDPQTPIIYSQELAQGIRGAELVVFDRSGHYPFIEQETEFWTAVQKFLSRQPE